MSTALEAVQMTHSASPPGLVSVESAEPPERIEEQYAIRQAAEIGGNNGINFVLFRRFSDGRSSQVSAWIIDNSDSRFTEKQLADLHKKLWLNGCSPLLYVSWLTRVDILSCARGPDFWNNKQVEYQPADTIRAAAQVRLAFEESQEISRYSAYRLSDGTFWDDPQNSVLAESGQAAHSRLIQAVIATDEAIEGERFPTLRRLLLLAILIKYLEDRQVFPPQWFEKFDKRADCFLDLLRYASPEIIRQMLAQLAAKFKGDVFDLPEDQHQLTQKQLHQFAELVEARTRGSAQRYLWEQYSFRHIPVEVLSHLYQHFAQKGKGAIFTPPFLANLILDYAMPYKHLNGDEAILDPTCGSGVFLAGAFRRLIHFWQSKNNWQKPDVPTLKEILKRSIFGVELQEEALHLTSFNLALALCDALQPNVIWRDLKFDKLVGTNLHIGDFSDWLNTRGQDARARRFAVIVGNPPFLSKLTQSAVKYRKQQRNTVAIPDKQMAYFVLEQATELLGDDGRLCLIQPNGFLYNEKARKFQAEFLSKHTLEAVLDFTSIRQLFDEVDPKTVALLARRTEAAANHQILHMTFRRTASVKERIAFELDHYDQHVFPQSLLRERPWIWRTNTLGGGRLQNLAAHFATLPTLRKFIESKGKEWDYGEGFIEGKKGERKKAPWLTGKRLLSTAGITEAGIDQSKILKVTAEKFKSHYTKKRFSAPLMLIKANGRLPCAFLKRGFLAYKDKIVGIHAPRKQEADLLDFYKRFRSNRPMLEAACHIFGTQALTGRATAILKRDMDVLPWPDGETWEELSWWETILWQDVNDYTTHLIRLGQNSELLREQVTGKQFESYANVFVRMLGTVYPNLRDDRFGLMNGLAYQSFCFGSQSALEWPDDWAAQLQKIVYTDRGDALRTIRLLRIYELNTIIIVKPDRLRYWIQSTAIRDADETITDLRRQGY